MTFSKSCAGFVPSRRGESAQTPNVFSKMAVDAGWNACRSRNPGCGCPLCESAKERLGRECRGLFHRRHPVSRNTIHARIPFVHQTLCVGRNLVLAVQGGDPGTQPYFAGSLGESDFELARSAELRLRRIALVRDRPPIRPLPRLQFPATFIRIQPDCCFRPLIKGARTAPTGRMVSTAIPRLGLYHFQRPSVPHVRSISHGGTVSAHCDRLAEISVWHGQEKALRLSLSQLGAAVARPYASPPGAGGFLSNREGYGDPFVPVVFTLRLWYAVLPIL